MAKGNRITVFLGGQLLPTSTLDVASISLGNLKQHVCDMRLLGFAVIDNPLRADSAAVISKLQERCGCHI